MKIPLGCEIGTGRPVSVPLRHLAVMGQTQLSGKTTALEALISRSSLRALAFITKRAEGAFRQFQPIPAYFREPTGWQAVSSLLEAALRERVKFERGAIIRACKGAKTLKDVHAKIQADLPKAHGINQEILERLNAYLEIVIPQIELVPCADKMTLGPGINVMDLACYSSEFQALVIRSSLEWIYQREEGVITVIPEAWEFVPQGRGSPVMEAAEELIRKGAAGRNFIWLDSQDLAGVNKRILRSVGVYLLGVQQELNEINRTLSQMRSRVRKPDVEEVRSLGIGQFFVCYDQTMRKVYVAPTWADHAEAQIAARSGGGIIPPPSLAEATEHGYKPTTNQQADSSWLPPRSSGRRR